MSTNTIGKIKLQNAILDIKAVQYVLWKEAYELLTDVEASKQKELYWELANKVANVSVSDVRFNPKDTELAEFINKRQEDVTKKQESLKSFIDFSEKWVANSKNVVKQNAALFTLLSIMKDKKITEEQSKTLIERLSTLSMDEYNSQDQYKTAQDILVDMSIEERIETFITGPDTAYLGCGYLSNSREEARRWVRKTFGLPLEDNSKGEYHK